MYIIVTFKKNKYNTSIILNKNTYNLQRKVIKDFE